MAASRRSPQCSREFGGEVDRAKGTKNKILWKEGMPPKGKPPRKNYVAGGEERGKGGGAETRLKPGAARLAGRAPHLRRWVRGSLAARHRPGAQAMPAAAQARACSFAAVQGESDGADM